MLKIKSNKIILIVLIAFLLNSLGMFYAYPLLRLVNDEVAIVSAVLKMINDFSLRPNFAENYYLAPAAYIYLPFYLVYFIILFLLGVVRSVAELREMILLDYASFKMILPVARFISVLAGSLSVYLVYKISKLLFKNDESASLWPAFFTATSLMFVQLSHFGRIWIIQVFFILLGFYYLSLILIKKKDDFKNYLISGILIALSFGIHLVGGVLYFCFLFVHYSFNQSKRFVDIFLKNRKFWLANLVILLSITFIYFLHPYGFEHYFNLSKKHIIIGQRLNDYVYSDGNRPDININLGYLLFGGLTYYIPILLEYEPILIILFLISLPVLFLKQRKIFYLLILFITAYYLFMGSILKIKSIRYILPIIPFLAMVAGYGFSYFLQCLSSKYLRNGLTVVFGLLFLFTPFYWSLSLLKPNTYVLTKKWIETNLPSGESIISLELDNTLVLNENKKTLVLLSEFMPKAVSARERYLLKLDEKSYPQPNYYIIYRPEKMPEGFLSQNQFNYLIVHWWDKKEKDVIKDKVAKLNYDLELAQKFYPNEAGLDLTDLVNEMRRPLYLLRNIRYTGAYIEIYKIRP